MTFVRKTRSSTAGYGGIWPTGQEIGFGEGRKAHAQVKGPRRARRPKQRGVLFYPPSINSVSLQQNEKDVSARYATRCSLVGIFDETRVADAVIVIYSTYQVLLYVIMCFRFDTFPL